MLGWNATGTDRFVTEQAAESKGVLSGIVSGTRIATGHGWRPVQALCAGDLVVTFDAGVQPLAGVTRHQIWTGDMLCPPRFWLLEVPCEVLGHRAPLRIMPHQAVLIESDLAETLWGDPFALLPGVALEDMEGVGRVPPEPDAEVVVLHFEADQVVFAEHGPMFLCPSARGLLDDTPNPEKAVRYEVLPLSEAQVLVAAMGWDGARVQSETCLQELGFARL